MKVAMSRYNVRIPLRKGRELVYNSLSGSMALWTEHDVHRFQQATVDAFSIDDDMEMVNAGFLIDASTDELKVLEQVYTAHRFDQKTMILTIAPTLACNFGCDYCFQGQQKPHDTMSRPVQDAILDLIERASARIARLHVAWYGGEPLLRKELVRGLSERILELCERRRLAYDASMVSNGYLLDRETAEMLTARRVQTIQITLDGVPMHHDRRRALLSGKPTFDHIVKNIRAVVEHTNITVNLRVNVDFRNRDDLGALLSFLSAQGLGGRPNFKVYFAPVEAITEGCHSVQGTCMPRGEYGRLEVELYREACSLGLAPLPYPPRFHGTCAAVRPKGLVIAPSGDVHKCWDTISDPRMAVGTVFDLDGLAKSEEARRWLRWSPLDNEVCRNCKLLPSCAGACAYKFLHADQTRGAAATLPCPSWKYNLHERLLLRAVQSGLLETGDYDEVEVRTLPSALCVDAALGFDHLPAKEVHLSRSHHPPGSSPALQTNR